MSVDLFASIVEKIRGECPAKDIYVALYNWGEPLLHPELPKLVRLARAAGLLPLVSTNLQAEADLDALIQARPHWIRISLSGLSPATYNKNHYPGDVHRLVRRLRHLSERWKALGAGFPIHLFLHKYKASLGRERDQVQALAAELGFHYDETWALLTPWEKLLAYYQGRLDPRCRAFIRRLALHPGDIPAVTLEHRPEHPDCAVRLQQTTIDFDGRLPLCCVVFDRSLYLDGAFLDLPHDAIQRLKYCHPFCGECMRYGLDILATHPAMEGFDRAVCRRLRLKSIPKPGEKPRGLRP